MTDLAPGAPPEPACISAGAEQNHAYDMGRDLEAPVVSVCMPAYNCQRYVAEAIESILGQTLRDFEFLIIDDGSTDGSLPILEGYAARDPRIRLTSRPNSGVPATLKELVDQSRGEFIARMDADDIALPERFEKQVNYLRAHPDCVVVGCRVWETDAEGDSIREYFTLADHDEIDAFHFRMTGPALVHPSIMLRRDAVLAVGGYRNFLIEDLDLYLRLAEYGRIARVPEFLLKYRIHSANLSFSAPFLGAFLSCAVRNLDRHVPETEPSGEPAATQSAAGITVAIGRRAVSYDWMGVPPLWPSADGPKVREAIADQTAARSRILAAHVLRFPGTLSLSRPFKQRII